MKKILYVSLVDWFWIKQRPQQIAEILSASYKVDFFCIRSWQSNSNAVVAHSDDDNLKKSDFSANKNLRIIRKKILPKRDLPIFRYLNYSIIERSRISKLIKQNHYDVIILTFPAQINYFTSKQIQENTFVYDCMDDYANFKDKPDSIIKKDESKMISSVDRIITSSKSLKEKIINRYGEENKAITVINNGVSLTNFDGFSKEATDVTTNIIGYIGAIDSWFDFSLVYNAAHMNKNFVFKIYGPIKTKIDENLKPKNVEFLGPVPYEELGSIARKFDIAIMPFRINDLIKSVNPVKLYEYLSVGLKVVATRYEETEKFGDFIELYNGQNEFNSCIEKLQAERYSKNEIKSRIEFAKSNDWHQRAKEFINVIENNGD